MPETAPTPIEPTPAPGGNGQSAARAETQAPPEISATTPGQLGVIKRNGTVVPYNDEKISIAITKAFLDVEGTESAMSVRVREITRSLTRRVTQTFLQRLPSGGAIHIEEIQDQVELALMREELQQVARSYVLYREQRRKEREAEQEQEPVTAETLLSVVDADGQSKPLDLQGLRELVHEACAGLQHVDADHIIEQTLESLYDGVAESEVLTSLIISSRALVEQDTDYSFVTARLLLHKLRGEVLPIFDLPAAGQSEMQALYPQVLPRYIERAVELQLLDPRLAEFDLQKIGTALQAERDLQFSYLGLQTLYDRYFLHWEDQRLELPQIFFMRVAMGLAVEEEQREERAIEFYQLLSAFDYLSSTPTLFNSGTCKPQLSSCYLVTVPDDLDGIFNAIHDNAMLSKWSGGLGNDWTPVRAIGSHIRGTNGKSQGVVPFLKVANDATLAVNQGGKRNGATCCYLETWHLDIEEFLELRKNTGDDRRRTHDMHTANWVPDLFMKRLEQDDSDWTLFSPDETQDLHELYGRDFEKRYEEYEQQAAQGELRNFKKVKTWDLWRRMISMLFDTGHPWITFKDACNVRSPQQHTGVVHSSNLCTEITLNTRAGEEIAVCNLGSVNLAAHVNAQGLDMEKLEKTVRTAVRMLDNVIDINYYSVEAARNSNLLHRPIGLGLMGFQDALFKQRIPYSSPQAVEFADRSMEAISYFAIQASAELAATRGKYGSYEGSLWSRGILPIDSLDLLGAERGEQFLQVNRDRSLDWDSLRKTVQEQGMRNSNVMAIAPTATISNIANVSQSIEPTYSNLYTKSNMSGEFTVVNPYLARDLKEQGLWDKVMVSDIKYCEGSVQAIDRVPQELKALYATAFEVELPFLVDAASRRQKWLDQAQSLNLYVPHSDGRKISTVYRMAWQSGLKTTYYLRTLGATATEKSTLNAGVLNSVPSDRPSNGAQACSIEDPDCEACQ